jgi:hypothetical protein
MNEYKRFFNHIPGNLEQSNYRIFEPDSKADILNWFGRDDIPNARKDEFIKALINFDDGCGNFYRHRTYFLAASALSYFPESYYGDVIVNQLLNWSYVYFGWEIIPKPLQTAAREALKVTDKQRVIAAFTNLLHKTTSRLTLRQAAVELEKLDTGNKTAIAALILLLDVSGDEYTQRKIIYSLANIGDGNDNVVQALISFLTNTSNVSLCWDTMIALGAVGQGNQQVIIALIERLKSQACQNDNDDYFHTAMALWKVDPGNLFAQDAFVRVLAGTNNLHLIYEVIDYLSEIDFDSPTVIKVLSQRLAEQEAEHIRIACAFHLAKLDVGNPIAKQTFVETIRNAEDVCLGNKALRYLLQFYPYQENIVGILGVTEISTDKSFSRAVVQNIQESGLTKHTSIDVLICIMQDSLSKDDCDNAINLLSLLNLGDDILGRNKIISALITFLHKNRGDVICLSAADTLLQIDPGNQTAINLLVEVLEVNRSEWICERAAQILLQAGYYHQEVVKKLIDLVSLQNSCNLSDLWRISSCLELIKDSQNYTNVVDTKIMHYLELFHNCLAPDLKEDSINICQHFSYNHQLVELSDKLLHILQPQHLPQVVRSLKSYLDKSSYYNTSYRYEAVYNLIWYCAQNMNYPDFCNAWLN